LAVAAEILSALMLALFWYRYGWSVKFALYTGSFLFLLVVALIDLKYRLVLNIMVYPAVVIAVLVGHAAPMIWVGGLLAFSMFALTAWLRPGDVGGGDIKLAALIGLALGFPDVLWALILGIGSGGIVAIVLLLSHRGSRQTRMAYAPYLCLGAMIALLYNPFMM
jgi:leader peptidase (prepilin peptidase)/N-methyltransferase